MSLYKKKIFRSVKALSNFAVIKPKLKILDKITTNNKKKSQIKIDSNTTVISAKIFAFNKGRIFWWLLRVSTSAGIQQHRFSLLTPMSAAVEQDMVPKYFL